MAELQPASNRQTIQREGRRGRAFVEAMTKASVLVGCALQSGSTSVSQNELEWATPYLTEGLAGTGGRIKVEPEDFVVEELPLYEPSGQGPHLYLWVEKRDVDAQTATRRVGQAFGISPADVGVAGNKDKRAVTRQWMSVVDEAGRWDEAPAQGVELGPEMRVVAASRHGNKLRTGHQRGNRFRIVVREVVPGALALARATVDRLAAEGMPNFYGTQRFGRGGSNVLGGLGLMQGRSGRALDRYARKMWPSAVQSWLFNRVLADRMGRGDYRRVLSGDVMSRVGGGGLFRVEDVEAEQQRFDAREIVHLGPMFGTRMFAAGGEAREREESILSACGVTLESFAVFGKLAQGTRRENIVYPEDASVQEVASGLEVCFSLPSGSYATVLLDEVMKNVRDVEGSD